MPDHDTYHVSIRRLSAGFPGTSATLELAGHAELHEALTAIMMQAAKAGWLIEWPELPAPGSMAVAELAARKLE